MELSGTPGLARVLALPAVYLALALATVLAWALRGGHWVGIAAASAVLLVGYELVRAALRIAAERRRADSWLRHASGRFVPPAYAWRASQLCSRRHRRMLARTLRHVVRSAFERPLGARPRVVPAVRKERDSLRALAETLERVDEPVTPAGILRVGDLLTDGSGPLWASRSDRALGEEISATLRILRSA